MTFLLRGMERGWWFLPVADGAFGDLIADVIPGLFGEAKECLCGMQVHHELLRILGTDDRVVIEVIEFIVDFSAMAEEFFDMAVLVDFDTTVHQVSRHVLFDGLVGMFADIVVYHVLLWTAKFFFGLVEHLVGFRKGGFIFGRIHGGVD
jgi:hypothetical protein